MIKMFRLIIFSVAGILIMDSAFLNVSTSKTENILETIEITNNKNYPNKSTQTYCVNEDLPNIMTKVVEEDGYGISPSEISNIDYERPDDNTEWIRELSIIYPQLYNMEDFNKQERINRLIIDKSLNYHKDVLYRDYIEYKTSYTIMYADDSSISILFMYEIHSPARYNTGAYTLNIDLITETIIGLEEYLINNNLEYVDIFSGYKITYGYYETEDGIVELANNYIDNLINSNEKEFYNDKFYFTGSEIGIILNSEYNDFLIVEGNVDSRE